MSELTPREIVSELDKYIIGQKEAKKAVIDSGDEPFTPQDIIHRKLIFSQNDTDSSFSFYYC